MPCNGITEQWDYVSWSDWSFGRSPIRAFEFTCVEGANFDVQYEKYWTFLELCVRVLVCACVRVRVYVHIVPQPLLHLRGGEGQKRIYYFGKNHAEGDSSMKSLLGGKGANCAEMAKVGLSVPPGFTITTSVKKWLDIGLGKSGTTEKMYRPAQSTTKMDANFQPAVGMKLSQI